MAAGKIFTMIKNLVKKKKDVDAYLKSKASKKIANKKFKIVLTQGLNRQIRRMCEYLNYEVKQLKRIRIMNINLDIREGEWRYFTAKELKEMHQILKKSTKTAL